MKSLLPPLTNSLLNIHFDINFFLPQRSDPALAAAALPPSSLFERDPESGPDQFDVRKKPAKVETHFTEDLEEKMEEERRLAEKVEMERREEELRKEERREAERLAEEKREREEEDRLQREEEEEELRRRGVEGKRASSIYILGHEEEVHAIEDWEGDY